MGDEGDVAVVEQRPRLGQDPVEPGRDLRGRLAVGALAAPGPDRPVGVVLVDLLFGEALVVAVRPLGQVLFDRGDGQSGEFGGADGPCQRAGRHQGEPPPRQRRTQRGRLPFPLPRQRHVGQPGVPSRPAPFGLPMPDQHQFPHADRDSRPSPTSTPPGRGRPRSPAHTVPGRRKGGLSSRAGPLRYRTAGRPVA